MKTRFVLLIVAALVGSSARCADPSATITGTANYVTSFTIGKTLRCGAPSGRTVAR
jgi:hypothetical protein